MYNINNNNSNSNNLIYFDSFGIENIHKKIKEFLGKKNIITDFCRIQGHEHFIKNVIEVTQLVQKI